MNLSHILGSFSKTFLSKIPKNASLSSLLPNSNVKIILPNGFLVNSSQNCKVIDSTISPFLKYNNQRIRTLSLNNIRYSILDTPTLNIDNYKNHLLTQINDILQNDAVIQNRYIDPLNDSKTDIQAARLIVIRRRKMKKHKLRKLRKKMKFEWAKVRQRREMRKEKIFQSELIAQIKEAEKFSAVQYVKEKLHQANTEPIPRYWKGKRLPQFIIKEKLGIK